MVVNPITKRVTGLMRGLSNMYSTWNQQAQNRDWMVRQMKIILDAIVEEIEEDNSMFANENAQKWILQFSMLMEWTVTGDRSKLPAELIPVVDQIEGTERVATPEEIRELVPHS